MVSQLVNAEQSAFGSLKLHRGANRQHGGQEEREEKHSITCSKHSGTQKAKNRAMLTGSDRRQRQPALLGSPKPAGAGTDRVSVGQAGVGLHQGTFGLGEPERQQRVGCQGERRNVLPVDARGSASGASPASRGTSPVSPRAASLLSCSAQGLDSAYRWRTTSTWPERDTEAKGSSCLEMETGKGVVK